MPALRTTRITLFDTSFRTRNNKNSLRIWLTCSLSPDSNAPNGECIGRHPRRRPSRVRKILLMHLAYIILEVHLYKRVHYSLVPPTTTKMRVHLPPGDLRERHYLILRPGAFNFFSGHEWLATVRRDRTNGTESNKSHLGHGHRTNIF